MMEIGSRRSTRRRDDDFDGYKVTLSEIQENVCYMRHGGMKCVLTVIGRHVRD